MVTVQVDRQVDAAVWNAGVARDPHGSVFQTTYWAEYYAAYLDDVPHYLTVLDDGEVIGRLLLQETLRGQEAVLGGRRARWKRTVAPLLKTFIWRQGPVVSRLERRMEALRACLQAVEALAVRRGITGIEEAYLPVESADIGREEFAAHGYRFERRATVLMDLQHPLERLWAQVKDAAQRQVRKAQRQGVDVRELRGLEEVGRFHALVSTWRREEGFPAYEPARYEQMFRHMPGQCAFFLAEFEDEPVAGAGIWHFNGRAHVFSPSHTRTARERGVAAGDVLHWELIRWCHARGLASLDLSGISPAPASTKETGIRRFKEKWGGQLAPYPIFYRPLRSASWALVSLVRTLRRWHRAAVVKV